MRKQKGFSLIELLIVVAIILIIAAIAIPNLLRAKIAANESSAAASTRQINTAELMYATAYPAVGYAPTLGALGPVAAGCAAGASAANACILDFVVSQGAKSGFSFTAAPVAVAGINTGYVINSWPTTLNSTGVKGFCSIEDSVIRYITPSPVPGVATAGAAGTCVTTYTAIQ